MPIFKIVAVLLILAAEMPLLRPLSAGAQDQPKAAENAAPSLIRMDLLGRPPSPTAPPKRNIFAPRLGAPAQTETAAQAAVPGALGLPPGNPGAAAPVSGAAAQPAAAPAFSIDLRYIGFVDSRRTRKIIGLVIFQGQARAVVEGEVISEGVRVGKISREQIEVILPDSSTRAFSLEGEE